MKHWYEFLYNTSGLTKSYIGAITGTKLVAFSKLTEWFDWFGQNKDNLAGLTSTFGLFVWILTILYTLIKIRKLSKKNEE